MREFLVAITPLVVFWTIPLVPLFVAAIAAILETVTKPARGDHQVAPNAVTVGAKASSLGVRDERVATSEAGR